MMSASETLKDAGLVGRTLDGDREAFGLLVERHSSVVFGVALSHLHNAADAEDVTQDVFLTAYKALNTLRDRRKFTRWLVTLARNRCRNLLRHRRLEAALPDRLDGIEAASRPRPERDEVCRLLREEMQELDESAREVLLLHYFSRKKIREIADILGISKSAAAKRLQRARTTLGERLVDVLGEQLRRGDKPKERTARVTAAVVGARPLWKTAAVAGAASEALESSVPLSIPGLGKVLGGVLLMKKTLIGLLLCAVALLAFWMSLDGWREEKAEPERTSAYTAAPRSSLAEPDGLEEDEQRRESAKEGDSEPIEHLVAPEEGAADDCLISDAEQYCSISGRIVDEAGAPIPGAEVLVVAVCSTEAKYREDTEHYFGALLDETRRFSDIGDASGAYDISGIPFRGSARVFASAEGYAQMRRVRVVLSDGYSLENVDVVLGLGETVAGRVLTEGGQPVAGAVVVPCGSSPKALAYTDKNGLFTIAGDRGDLHWLRVFKPGLGFVTFSDVPAPSTETIELRMPGTAVLKGRTTCPDNASASGLHVRLVGAAEIAGRFLLHYPSTFTDENGRYEIAGLDVGLTYEVAVYDNQETLRARADLGYLEPGKETVWNCQIQDPICIHGHVCGQESREPIMMPSLFAVRAVKDDQEVAVHHMKHGGGAYSLRIPGVSGKYLICPSYEPYTHHGFENLGREVYLTPGEEKEIDLFVPEPFTMAIRVIDEADRPVLGATVGRSGSGLFTVVGVTDESGRYQYAGFTPVVNEDSSEIGEGCLTVSHPGYVDEESTHQWGYSGEAFPEETIVLYRAAGVRGRAVDVDGSPFAGAGLELTVHYGDGSSKVLDLRTNADGLFRESESIPATECSFEAMLWHRQDGETLRDTWRCEPIDCTPGQVTDLGAIVFAPRADP
ncbi:MAG TPA: sigma-70 family RNA polymerase sigma factor [Candidatus Hydrogenedentes bacterium]|nr:sigma-70 family RNA polymerase sigma factor [Candidatus Hydrogenedentota bacterium]